MNDSTVHVPSNMSMPGVKFATTAEFQKRDLSHEGDAAFMKYTKRSWMQPKGNEHQTREVIATLLTSPGGENVDDCIERLLAEEISYNDLAALTETDLELMGFKQLKQRVELLGFLKQLPNQDPSYDNILKLPEAKSYNRKMLNNACAHLESMRSALSASNYKLKIMPTEDVIVGEKSFASKFVLEALEELKGVTDEIDAQLAELEEIVSEQKSKTLQSSKPKQSSGILIGLCLLVSSVATATLAAMWFWKFSK